MWQKFVPELDHVHGTVKKILETCHPHFFFFLVNYILIPTHSLVFHFGSHNLRCFYIDIMITIVF